MATTTWLENMGDGTRNTGTAVDFLSVPRAGHDLQSRHEDAVWQK